MHISTITDSEVCVSCFHCGEEYYLNPHSSEDGYPEGIRDWFKKYSVQKCMECFRTSPLTGDTIWANMLSDKSEEKELLQELKDKLPPGRVVRFERILGVRQDCDYVAVFVHAHGITRFWVDNGLVYYGEEESAGPAIWEL